MRGHWSLLRRLLIVVALALASAGVARAEAIGTPAFQRLWQRTDLPVQQRRAAHSWVWGPEPFTGVLNEAYDQSPGLRRQVQYFDKSRMEINQPGADQNAGWYVTNGLLATEMITGAVQIGDTGFVPLGPAAIPAAGDPGGAFPTYADLAAVYNEPAGRRLGERVVAGLPRDGVGQAFPARANDPGTEIVQLDRDFGLPRAFWDFLNQTSTVFENGQYRRGKLVDRVFVAGLPTTDAYWARVRVGGVERDVMLQAFERRVLTYTPDNPAPFKVEMGNVGRHYYQWRYVAPFAGGQRAVITAPEAGAFVSSPLVVQGFENGDAFEGALTVRLKSQADGAVLASQPVTVRRPDVNVPGPFQATLTFTVPPNVGEGVVEVTISSPADGSTMVLATRDVNFIVTFPGGKRAQITAPTRDAFVSSPLTVSGRENGSAFEAAVTVRLREKATGRVVASQPTIVRRPDIGKPGPFEATLTWPAVAAPFRGVVDVVAISPADGSTTVLDSVEVNVAS